MGSLKALCNVSLLQLFIVLCLVFQCFATRRHADLRTTLVVDASDATGRPIPETLFGIFFEVWFLALIGCYLFVQLVGIFFLN